MISMNPDSLRKLNYDYYQGRIRIRKSIRLSGYDYSQPGDYFITIVTQGRQSLFGEIMDNEMVLNDLGRIIAFAWNDLINHNADIGLDEFVIMPNHIHGIINIFPSAQSVRAGSKPALFIEAVLEPASAPSNEAGLEPASTELMKMENPWKRLPLSEIVRQFKTFSARRINELRKTPGVKVWQRNYYDRIIGSDREYEQIAAYIANNPANWLNDKEK